MKITWHLTCSKDVAVGELKKHIDGPLSPAFMGGSYKGFISDDSFSIWSKLDRFGSRTAIAKGLILKENKGSVLEATIKVPFLFSLLPESAKFYWYVVPSTIILWIADVFIMVTNKYTFLASVTFPLTAAGILIMLLGFMKMMGSDNKMLLERKLKSIYQDYIK
jgi:hypothetical protein